MTRLERWWRALDAGERARWHAVTLCGALLCVHYVLWSHWYVEDAAISFTFARHVATGEGFVAWPGGERVQGFSNPSWTLLLAASDAVGLNPWVAAKLYGAAFALLTLPLAYRWARLLAPGSDLTAALAPLVLALSPQFVLWAASGLENGLMNLLVAWAAVWLLEGRRRPEWVALPLGALAITRPEGPLYVAILVGVAGGLAARRTGTAAVAPMVRLAALAAAPWIAWMAFCWWYFAWPLPNTYYAKLVGMRKVQPWAWDGTGWRYVRRWALWTGWGVLLPTVGVLHGGLAGRRGRIGAAAGVVLALAMVTGASWVPAGPAWIGAVRVAVVAALVIGLPWLGRGRPGLDARILAWAAAGAAILYPVYGGGSDWMVGFRWMSSAAVPLAVLFVDLVVQVRDALGERQPRARQLAPLILAAPIGIAALGGIGARVVGPETSPFGVRLRVEHMAEVRERLHLDEVVALDVDMGAQMWWGRYALYDLAGLVDVPMGHHRWEPPFLQEYVFEEVKPQFAHVHGHWARRTGIQKQPAWAEAYLRVAPYPVGGGRWHQGNHIRRDLFLRPTWEGDRSRKSRFDRSLHLLGLDLPVQEVAPGQSLHVRLGWRSPELTRGEARPLLFLSGQGRLVVKEVPMGYDWTGRDGWREDEVITGRHTLSLPEDLPEGSYDLGLLLLGGARGVIPAHRPTPDPVLAAGELRFYGAIQVESLSVVEARMEGLVAEALAQLGAGACDEAEGLVERARRYLNPDHPDTPRERPRLVEAFAACWAQAARRAATDPEALRAIANARRWNHRHRDVRRAADELADRWSAAGDEARDEGDPASAHAAWSMALAADPTRSWLRRRTEEVRDLRLGLGR